jgi:hypothetical protein
LGIYYKTGYFTGHFTDYACLKEGFLLYLVRGKLSEKQERTGIAFYMEGGGF